MTEPKAITVNEKLINKVKLAVKAGLSYEKATDGRRKLGITGEVGELLACKQLGLKLVLDTRSEGFDAIDKRGLRVEIKSRRSESEGLPRDVGRTSSFSKHKFDYAILVCLDKKYRLREIWRADYRRLRQIIEKQKRRNPNLASFKRVGEKIFESG